MSEGCDTANWVAITLLNVSKILLSNANMYYECTFSKILMTNTCNTNQLCVFNAFYLSGFLLIRKDIQGTETEKKIEMKA